MPKKMVNGLTMKIEKYCYCGTLLEGKRSRYCSNSCYNSYRKVHERKHYLKYHPPLPKITCINCLKIFIPRTTRQECCSKSCRGEISTKNRAKKSRGKSKVKASIYYKKFFAPKYRGVVQTELSDKVNNISSSSFREEIDKFLESGGKVKILPDQLNGRVPGVGSANLLRITQVSGEDFALTDGTDVSGDWEAATMSGFGYELHIMDDRNDQD
tara:strand:+ start:713 stop:1351 length:639 start_codon:yes stop_codon:yes gene_type:complete